MGLVRGDPVVLVAMFFGAAVLLMGGLYAFAPAVFREPTPVSVATLGALVLSLGFCILVLGRIFWVVSRAANQGKVGRATRRK